MWKWLDKVVATYDTNYFRRKEKPLVLKKEWIVKEKKKLKKKKKKSKK